MYIYIYMSTFASAAPVSVHFGDVGARSRENCSLRRLRLEHQWRNSILQIS